MYLIDHPFVAMDRRVVLVMCILTVCVVQYGDAEMVFRQNPVCGTDHAHNAPRSRATVKTKQGIFVNK